MARDRKLDPTTGDYIPDGAGGWEYVDTIESEVHHRLRDQRDRFAGDPQHGSDLHLLKKGHLDERTRIRAKAYAEVALQPVLDGGRGANLRVDARIEKSDPDPAKRGVVVETQLTDVTNGAADVSNVTPLSTR